MARQKRKKFQQNKMNGFSGARRRGVSEPKKKNPLLKWAFVAVGVLITLGIGGYLYVSFFAPGIGQDDIARFVERLKEGDIGELQRLAPDGRAADGGDVSGSEDEVTSEQSEVDSEDTQDVGMSITEQLRGAWETSDIMPRAVQSFESTGGVIDVGTVRLPAQSSFLRSIPFVAAVIGQSVQTRIIAYLDTGNNGINQVFIRPVDGGTPVQLTKEDTSVRHVQVIDSPVSAVFYITEPPGAAFHTISLEDFSTNSAPLRQENAYNIAMQYRISPSRELLLTRDNQTAEEAQLQAGDVRPPAEVVVRRLPSLEIVKNYGALVRGLSVWGPDDGTIYGDASQNSNAVRIIAVDLGTGELREVISYGDENFVQPVGYTGISRRQLVTPSLSFPLSDYRMFFSMRITERESDGSSTTYNTMHEVDARTGKLMDSWDNVSSVMVSPDGNIIYMKSINRETGKVAFEAYNRSTGQRTQLFSMAEFRQRFQGGEKSRLSFSGFGLTEKKLLFHEFGRGFYVYDTESGELSKLFSADIKSPALPRG